MKKRAILLAPQKVCLASFELVNEVLTSYRADYDASQRLKIFRVTTICAG